MPPDEQPLANDQNARTPEGEIKDLGTNQTPEQIQAAKDAETAKAAEVAKAAEGKGKDGTTLLTKKDEAKPAAPEKYEAFKVPDGFTLDEKVATEAGALFKEAGLSQDAAQKLVDFYTAKTQEAFQQPYKAYKDMREGWVKDSNADPEISGKLAKGGPVLTTIAKALDGLGDSKLTDQFKEAMDLTGVGDHPAFIKTFYRLAQMVTEGGSVAGRGPASTGQSAPGTGRVSAAQALYPNLK